MTQCKSVDLLKFGRKPYSSLRPWGIVALTIFTPSYHHPPYPFFTIIFHPPYHQRNSHPSTHFMYHSHYHSSTPFSCIILIIILQLHFSSHSYHQKKILIIHFSLSSHHHLNYAPRSLIENRLVNNIDTLIRKINVSRYSRIVKYTF